MPGLPCRAQGAGDIAALGEQHHQAGGDGAHEADGEGGIIGGQAGDFLNEPGEQGGLWQDFFLKQRLHVG